MYFDYEITKLIRRCLIGYHQWVP